MNKSCIQKLSVRASHQFRCSSWIRAFLNWSYMWHVGKVRIHIRYVTYRIYRNLYTSRFWWICRFAVSSFAIYMCRCHGWWLDLITVFHHTIGRFQGGYFRAEFGACPNPCPKWHKNLFFVSESVSDTDLWFKGKTSTKVCWWIFFWCFGHGTRVCRTV